MSDKKVTISINGKEVEAQEGMPLLQAGIDAGVEVPHFCYHPGIGVEGSCRLCLVEVKGAPKLMTSCTVPVKEGMEVSTETEEVKKARKGVLEFFLLHHPLDCPFCDKGGECPLQNYTYDAGQFSSRFEFEKLHKPKHQVIGDHIVLDKERCVLCNRCVRFLDNSTGREELQIRNRGSRSEIFMPEGTQLTQGYTGNLSDICPVGALTSREFRFKARPWELITVDTICGECSLGCSAQAWKKDKNVLRLTPRIEPKVNEWWLCDKGRYSLSHLLRPDRLISPVKPGDEASHLTAEEIAVGIVAQLRKVPSGTLAWVVDSGRTNEEFFHIKKLRDLIGSGRIFAPISSHSHTIWKDLSNLNLVSTFPDNVEKAGTVMIIGESLEKAHPILVLRLRKLVKSGRLNLITAGPGDLNFGFSDIESAHIGFKEDDKEASARFFQALKRIEAGENPASRNKSEEVAWRLLSEKRPLHVFLSDQILSRSNLRAVQEWLQVASSRHSDRLSISLLLDGTNVHGFLDQWDSSVVFKALLENEIQSGRVEGLLWFGMAPKSETFREYAKGMRVFVQWVYRLEDAHPSATWVFPLDSFLEKEGTYTNTFGHVQRLRRTTRLIQKGFEPRAILTEIGTILGQSTRPDVGHLYEELVRGLETYPRTMSQIPESRKTYANYERALWR